MRLCKASETWKTFTMRKSSFSRLLVSCVALFHGQAQAFLPTPPLPPPIRALFAVGSDGGNGSFEQYIDHANPSLGTFSQKFWWNSTYWAGPGSPVRMAKEIPLHCSGPLLIRGI